MGYRALPTASSSRKPQANEMKKGLRFQVLTEPPTCAPSGLTLNV